MVSRENWAQVRDATDSGRTGDKVCASDPAAAPLGTDEEAGGHATSPEDIARTIPNDPPRRPRKTGLLEKLGLRARDKP
jgi:hypothetical protein